MNLTTLILNQKKKGGQLAYDVEVHSGLRLNLSFLHSHFFSFGIGVVGAKLDILLLLGEFLFLAR